MTATTQIIRRSLTSGLYRLTVDGDAQAFDWESLYLTLNIHNNVNQRTGPWDFNLLDRNRPLLPAYWIYLNDRKIGLWYFNRPSDTEIRCRRFKGEASFWITESGEYELRFEPYQPFALTWTDARLEPEPEDTLLPRIVIESTPKAGRGTDASRNPPAAPSEGGTTNLRAAADHGLQRLFDAAAWQRLRQRLDDPGFPYRHLLAEAFDWAKEQVSADEPSCGGEHAEVQERFYDSLCLPLLAAAVRLRDDREALTLARQMVEHFLELPAWGNPREDGYGHNGDMGAADTFDDLVWTLNFLGDDLGETLSHRLLSRLEIQGDRLLELGLLHRGYWGGSIVQDHGSWSFGFFTTAAYGLLGWTPRAEHWLRFCLPRMQRTLNALPTDGVVPQSSYHILYRYTDKVVILRELHRQATGEDLYDRPALRNVPHFAYVSYVPERQRFLHACTRGDLVPFFGGHPFLDQMARAFGDAEAAWLAGEYVRIASGTGRDRGVKFQAMFQATLWAALLWEPVDLPEPKPATRRLDWFRDTGAVLYRDNTHGLLVSARCGPPLGLTAYKSTTCPCDRLSLAPASGMFSLVRRGRVLLQNAESGYKTRTGLANVMLVDGRGQLGDHAPPMSLSDAAYGGEQIIEATADCVKMDLTCAYDPEFQLARYTREFHFNTAGSVRVIDHVTSAVPHRFAWLFHTYRSHPIHLLGPLRYRIDNPPEQLTLTARATGATLAGRIADTLVVWAYRNENLDEAFHHVAFATETAVCEITVGFDLQN